MWCSGVRRRGVRRTRLVEFWCVEMQRVMHRPQLDFVFVRAAWSAFQILHAMCRVARVV